MSIQAALHHVTHYQYDRRIHLGPQVIRLRPAPHCRTNIKSYSLSLGSETHFLNWQQDPFGNFLARVVFPDRVSQLRVEVDLVAELVAINPFDFFVEPSAEKFPFSYGSILMSELEPYLRRESWGPRFEAWMQSVKPGEIRTIDLLTDLNSRLAQEIRYLVRYEPGVQTPEETLELSSGSCRDSGWLLVHILRHLGIAARFVSGYLIQLSPDEKSLDGPSGPEKDFCDLHAWAEAYLPGAGWVGLDPTSGLLAGEGHIPLASTPTPGSAAPITGTLDDCETKFDVVMQVSRIAEVSRVTKPYSEVEWAAINAEGAAIDQRLKKNDVRLTMGGEPTFVSIDDPDGEEWNTGALGEHKAKCATDLVMRLKDRFAPQGVVQFGQGKWYPGEALPRWAYSVHWREDGQPLWSRRDMIATTASKAVSPSHAENLIVGIAKRLGVDPSFARPAFENPWLGMARAQMRATDNGDDLQSAQKYVDKSRFELGAPVGYVLPVQPWQSQDRRGWRSERWRLPTEQLFLIPGDSPIGFRLPLDAIGSDKDSDIYPQIPFERAAPFPAPTQIRMQRPNEKAPGFADSGTSIRSTLSVEVRNGIVHVFLPPLPSAEDYVSLIGAVEDSATELDLPLRLEGYEPPPDHRMQSIKVTPDPGVIEVNVAPASSWEELVCNTEVLYEEARQCRLRAEKFMQDGHHTGTGGGNHVVLGGATPADSPFLRRPDLLKSILGYFINHPSLSYLFSGMFVGPTSQAPRVDEARDDALYELEIALDQIPPHRNDFEGSIRPWIVDRVLRDVLVDVTGNTHRTEICIDKLYSPDSPTGRLGLVEFRGFEMPPHARMNLAQGLLIRALVARFWECPYVEKLQHWGAALHDRFMLPHFVWQDLCDVIEDLNRFGFKLESKWFLPHFEFRFPHIGRIRFGSIELELRRAIEPWHVTGEHGVIGGTARYVDSSLERLQVCVNGFNDSRYLVTCNGRPVPLNSTGVSAEFAAGVRFRAWQPPLCLHPTIGVDAPLVFDLVDQWSKRSVAGCTYHVGHPGGRNPEKFPVNALEAEGRRIARFSIHEHTGGPCEVRMEPKNPMFPCTLDMRRVLPLPPSSH